MLYSALKILSLFKFWKSKKYIGKYVLYILYSYNVMQWVVNHFDRIAMYMNSELYILYI